MGWPLSGDFTTATVNDIPEVIESLVKAINQRQDNTIKWETLVQTWPYWDSGTGTIQWKKDVTAEDWYGGPIFSTLIPNFIIRLYGALTTLLGTGGKYYYADKDDIDTANGVFAWWAGDSYDWSNILVTSIGSYYGSDIDAFEWGFIDTDNVVVSSKYSTFSNAYASYSAGSGTGLANGYILDVLEAARDLLDDMTIGIWQPFAFGTLSEDDTTTPPLPYSTTASIYWSKCRVYRDIRERDIESYFTNYVHFVADHGMSMGQFGSTYYYMGNYTASLQYGASCTKLGLTGIAGTKITTAFSYVWYEQEPATAYFTPTQISTAFTIDGSNLTVPQGVRDFNEAMEGATLTTSWPSSFTDVSDFTIELASEPVGNMVAATTPTEAGVIDEYTNMVRIFFANPYWPAKRYGALNMFPRGTSIFTDLSSLLDDQS